MVPGGERLDVTSRPMVDGRNVWAWQIANYGPAWAYVRWDGGEAEPDTRDTIVLPAGAGYQRAVGSGLSFATPVMHAPDPDDEDQEIVLSATISFIRASLHA